MSFAPSIDEVAFGKKTITQLAHAVRRYREKQVLLLTSSKIITSGARSSARHMHNNCTWPAENFRPCTCKESDIVINARKRLNTCVRSTCVLKNSSTEHVSDMKLVWENKALTVDFISS